MKILITGGCGFVGSNLAVYLKNKLKKKCLIYSLDNVKKDSSKLNEKRLKKIKIKNFRIDISNYKKVINLPKFNLIIDCCAEPAVETSRNESKRVIDTNLIGTINTLEKVKKDQSALIFISTSRVYPVNDSFKRYKTKKTFDESDNVMGINTLYGCTKLASEMLIKEYNYAFKTKYSIIRSGLINGPWQFGKVEQGIASLWLKSHYLKNKIDYIGFGGKGRQIRDILSIDDFCDLIFKQIKKFNTIKNQTFRIGGGVKNSIDLKSLTKICQSITGERIKIGSVKKTSIYDIPYFVASNKKAKKMLNWIPRNSIKDTLKKTFLWMQQNKKMLENKS